MSIVSFERTENAVCEEVEFSFDDAVTKRTVLVDDESGSGCKVIMCLVIHYLSLRKFGLCLNCPSVLVDGLRFCVCGMSDNVVR